MSLTSSGWETELVATARRRTVGEVTEGWLASFPSPATREAYSRDVRRFLRWCAERGVLELEDMTRTVVAEWVRSEDERTSAASVARRVASVRSWFEALVVAGVVAGSPVVGIKLRPVSKEGVTREATDDEARRLLAQARTMGDELAAFVGVMVLHGLRFSTACTLPAETVAVLPSGAVAFTAVQKGNKRKQVIAEGELAAALRRLVAVHRTGPLFPRFCNDSDPRHQTARRDFNRVAQLAGVKVTPHQLRVWGITAAMDMDGIEGHDVRHFAGHSTIDTTLRYDRRPARRAGMIAEGLEARLAAASEATGGAP